MNDKLDVLSVQFKFFLLLVGRISLVPVGSEVRGASHFEQASFALPFENCSRIPPCCNNGGKHSMICHFEITNCEVERTNMLNRMWIPFNVTAKVLRNL
jgi:hypothetical protein